MGSAAAAYLIDQGHQVWVLDNLSTGHRELALGDGLTVGNAGDQDLVNRLCQDQSFDCAMHFAAKSIVPESFLLPDEYRENNVDQTLRLLQTLLKHGVRRFIFSSTCAIFGDPEGKPINEALEKRPISPYGKNKLEVEQALEQLAQDQGLCSIALRYFNAAGADPRGRVGEWHENESHLIPRILTAAQESKTVNVYGNDYPTPDGTCIRDYVHVWDLAGAHALAMVRLLTRPVSAPGIFEAYNLGSEKGFSVLEVIESARKITGSPLPVQIQERRQGDPPILVADSTLAKKDLGYRPQFVQLAGIVGSAWKWQQHLSTLRKKASS